MTAVPTPTSALGVGSAVYVETIESDFEITEVMRRVVDLRSLGQGRYRVVLDDGDERTTGANTIWREERDPTVVKPIRLVRYTWDGLPEGGGPHSKRLFDLVTGPDGSEVLWLNMGNQMLDALLGYEVVNDDEDADEDGLRARVTPEQRAQIEVMLWTLARSLRDTPGANDPAIQASMHDVWETMHYGAVTLDRILNPDDYDKHGNRR